MTTKKKGNIRAKSILIIGIFTVLLVLLLSISLIVPDIFKNIKFSVYNEKIHLSDAGSIGWWVGECRDDTHECEQLKKVTFSNVIYIDDDWKVTSSKQDWYTVFGRCYPIVEKRPSSTQTTYEYFFHRPNYRYTTYDRCIMDYKLNSVTVDKNGCTVKSWTWYDGVLNRYHDVISPWSAQKCWKKNELSRSEYYYSNDNKEAGQKSHNSGGSEMDFIWDCHQKINIYYKNELIGFVDSVQSDDFLVDMDNKIVYDHIDFDLVDNTKNVMRIKYHKSKYKGEPYYDCDYIMNSISWDKRECLNDDDCNDQDDYTLFDTCESYQCKHSERVECLNDSDCDDQDPFTLNDKCIDYKCIISEQVECLNDSDCDDHDPYTLDDKCIDYKCVISGQVQCLSDNDCDETRECIDNVCVMRYDCLDDDQDGVLNKDDKCIDTYGSDEDGCPIMTEKVVNFIKEISYRIWVFFAMKS